MDEKSSPLNEVAGLFEDESGSLPEVLFLEAEGSERMTGELPDWLRSRLTRLSLLFPQPLRIAGEGILACRYPTGRHNIPLPAWLAPAVPPPGEVAVPFYRIIRSLLPASEDLFALLSKKDTGELLLKMLQAGEMTQDMLVALLDSPLFSGKPLTDGFSARLVQDLQKLRETRGPTTRHWAIMAETAFRINCLRMDKAGELDKLAGWPPYARLIESAKAIHGNTILAGRSLWEYLRSEKVGMDSIRELLHEFPTPQLVRACAAGTPEPPPTGLFSTAAAKRFEEDLLAAPKMQPSSIREAARFDLIHLAARLQARQRPFLLRDCLRFLKKKQDGGSRRFLIMESGLNTVVTGLAGMDDETRKAFLAAAPADITLLVENALQGQIALAHPKKQRDATWQLAEEWQALERVGLW